jgi:hypothetical protein
VTEENHEKTLFMKVGVPSKYSNSKLPEYKSGELPARWDIIKMDLRERGCEDVYGVQILQD